MFSFFSWLRRRVAESIVAGVQDGIEAIDAADTGERPALVLPDGLRRLAVPAVPEAESENGHKKAKVRT